MHLFFTYKFVLECHKFKVRKPNLTFGSRTLSKKCFGMEDFYETETYRLPA